MVNSCFKHKANLIKCLIFLVSILIVILVALAITLVGRNEGPICGSEQCIKISAELVKYVDKTQNPCEDFQAFSCGRYARNRNEFPPTRPEDDLNLMIAEPVLINDTKPLIMQKLFYHSCVNLGAIEMDNDETILDIFYSLGEWPVLKGANWSGTYFDWTDIAKRCRNLGLKIDWFLDFSVHEDYNNTRTHVLKIDVPKFLAPLRAHEIALKKRLFTDVALIMGGPKYLVHYETAKTIEFEDALAILMERQRSRNKVHNLDALPKLTINEIQILWPNIQWLDLINNVTGNRMVGSDNVIFNILHYVQDLNQLIYGTPKRIVADYMLWKIVEDIWPFLSQPIRDKFEKFNEELYSGSVEENRQKFCLEESHKQFPLVVESVYIRRHVTEQKQQLVGEMFVLIQSKFLKLLQNSINVRREYRQRALTKLQETKLVIGGLDEVFDEFHFAESLGLYAFAFKSKNIIDMITERKARFYDKSYLLLNRRIQNRSFAFYERVVNITHFVVVHNRTIIIPAALLKDQLYSPTLPNYFNFATLGRVVAQEIFKHIFSFPDVGEWTRIFQQATRCLVKEPSPLHQAELKTSSKMGQLLGDFAAIDVAYEAYKEWLLLHPLETSLVALDFTPGQLFWIHSSRPNCNKISNRSDKDSSRFKIIEPLKNSENFAKEYLCPKGSRMNPRNKCRIL